MIFFDQMPDIGAGYFLCRLYHSMENRSGDFGASVAHKTEEMRVFSEGGP